MFINGCFHQFKTHLPNKLFEQHIALYLIETLIEEVRENRVQNQELKAHIIEQWSMV